MPFYKVVWTIEIDAENIKEAAIIANEIQKDPDSVATTYEIIDEDNNKSIITLSEDEKYSF